MRVQNTRFGVLSTYNRTWFVRSSVVDVLDVSAPVLCESSLLVASFSYFITLARNDFIPNRYFPIVVCVDESDDDEAGDQNNVYKGPVTRNRSLKRTQGFVDVTGDAKRRHGSDHTDVDCDSEGSMQSSLSSSSAI